MFLLHIFCKFTSKVTCFICRKQYRKHYLIKMRARVVLFKGRPLKNGNFPLKLKLSEGNEKKYINLKLNIPESDWNIDRLKDKRTRKQRQGERKESYQDYLNQFANYENLRNTILEIEKKYNDKILSLNVTGKPFSIEELVEYVNNPKPKAKRMKLLEYFEEIIGLLNEANKIGNRKVYTVVRNSISEYLGNKNRRKDLCFHEVDIPFLNRYTAYMEGKGASTSTINLYLRTLRALFNRAIDEGVTEKDYYPFDRYSITRKFKSKTRKIAISVDEINNIKELAIPEVYENKAKNISRKHNGKKKLTSEDLEQARQIFLFSYYAAGMNFKDIALLKWKDIKEDHLRYIRAKTNKAYIIPLHEFNKEVLFELYLLTGMDKENYVFPILNRNVHKEPMQIHNRYKKLLGYTNECLKVIGKMVESSEDLTTYVARHSWITNRVRLGGVSIDTIQATAGHSELSTTSSYIKAANRTELEYAVTSMP